MDRCSKDNFRMDNCCFEERENIDNNTQIRIDVGKNERSGKSLAANSARKSAKCSIRVSVGIEHRILSVLNQL